MTYALKLVLYGTVMELTLVFIFFLVNINLCKGFKISSKLNFDDEAVVVSDALNVKLNETKNEEFSKPGETKSFEAKIPVLVSRKNDGYEIKIPLTVESNQTDDGNKVGFLSGLQLFERRIDTEEKKSKLNPVPIVRGSLNHLKPNFLIPLPYEPTTTVKSDHETTNNNFLNYWPVSGSNEHKNVIEGLKPPAPDPDGDKWILDTSPFLQNTRNISSSLPNNIVGPSVWQITDSGIWNLRDPMSWNQERKNYWMKKKEWSSSKPKYYTRNVRYPMSYQGWNGFSQEPPNKPRTKGVWISCPPFEIGGITGRENIPGCPQYLHSKPPDVETVNITPIYAIDDRTLFKELERTKPEEPKA